MTRSPTHRSGRRMNIRSCWIRNEPIRGFGENEHLRATQASAAVAGSPMVSQTTTNASRPECAADVNVKSRLEPQVAEPPNTNCRLGSS